MLNTLSSTFAHAGEPVGNMRGLTTRMGLPAAGLHAAASVATAS